jgi:hypothetical protein
MQVPRYRYLHRTVDGCKSLIYFTGLYSSHHLNKLKSGFPHFTYCCSPKYLFSSTPNTAVVQLTSINAKAVDLVGRTSKVLVQLYIIQL